MRTRKLAIVAVAVALSASLAAVIPTGAAALRGPATPAESRFVAVATSAADYTGLKADVRKAGGHVVSELPELAALVVRAPKSAKGKLAASKHAAGVAADHVVAVSPPEGKATRPQRDVTKVDLSQLAPPVTPDPAYFLPGLLWNEQRVRMTDAWAVTTGSSAVRVAVADTGLDYTHHELASKVVHVEDLADHTLCKTLFGLSDAELAAEFGGPADGDWYGHGSWIGGNIAGVLDGQGVNGIAPDVNLVSLKIAEWCGFANDSDLIEAFLFAADNRIDIVNISFGGYLDRSDPDQDLIYELYVDAVKYAKKKGTVIVASAGNEHVRIGAGGKVLSHGLLTAPGTTSEDFVDLFGLYEVPGGIPGVVDVAATGNVVNAGSASCAPGTFETSNATCKPAADAHQPAGSGLQDQLAYYSNFGPRIDVAGPGGARKFNLPVWDRGGTPGFPVTSADGTAAWQDFSITSNFATQIPCFVFSSGSGFPAGQCYTTIQGTSMATPHAAAVVALIASARPNLQGHPQALIQRLRHSVRSVSGNTTPVLSATDLSPGDQSGVACGTGFCHLGGPAVSDHEAYGAGIVDAAEAVGAR
jgi:lantibiotic leader peptide-processing serine protease